MMYSYPYQRVSIHLAVLLARPDVLVQAELQALHCHYNAACSVQKISSLQNQGCINLSLIQSNYNNNIIISVFSLSIKL